MSCFGSMMSNVEACVQLCFFLCSVDRACNATRVGSGLCMWCVCAIFLSHFSVLKRREHCSWSTCHFCSTSGHADSLIQVCTGRWFRASFVKRLKRCAAAHDAYSSSGCAASSTRPKGGQLSVEGLVLDNVALQLLPVKVKITAHLGHDGNCLALLGVKVADLIAICLDQARHLVD
jgi:hypothetical protein